MRRFSYIAWTWLAAAWCTGFSACPQGDVRVLPGDGDRNVPVNAVLRVRYVGPAYIHPSYVSDKNFKLTDCQNSKMTSPSSNPDASGSTSEEKEKPTDQQTSGEIAVSIRLLPLQKGAPLEKPLKDGSTEKVFPTDVFMLPQAETDQTSPLKKNNRYCLAFNDVEDEEGHVYRGKKVSFTTERESTFMFYANGSLSWDHYQNWEIEGAQTQMTPRDALVIRFDRPVPPTQVEQVVAVCKATPDTSTTQTNGCGEYGMTESRHAIMQFENFYPVKKGETASETTGYLTVRYDTYGVSGSPSYEAGKSNTAGPEHLLLLRSENSEIVFDDQAPTRTQTFQVRENQASVTPDVLKAMGYHWPTAFWVTESSKTQ